MFSLRPPTLYIQIKPDWISVDNITDNLQISEPAELAMAFAPTRQILAVGDAARTAIAQANNTALAKLITPFAHPRSLISDFEMAEALLKACLQKVYPKTLFPLTPHLVVHLQTNPEGGFTPVEIRAFTELALEAGGSKVWLWHGRELQREEVLHKQFPLDGGSILATA